MENSFKWYKNYINDIMNVCYTKYRVTYFDTNIMLYFVHVEMHY